jgi:hypothetical protein
MANPALDLATYLAGQGLGLTLGTNLFWGLERFDGPGVPANSVFVYSMPGGPPDRNADTRIEHRFPIVHVRVRQQTNGGAEALAEAIMTALQGADLGGEYMDLRALQSGIGVGQSPQSGIHLHSIAYEVVYESDVR